jgi:hypothetical protein
MRFIYKMKYKHMKRVFCILLLCGLALGCQDRGEAGAKTSDKPDLSKLSRRPQAPPDTREAYLLMRNYWIFEYYVAPDNEELSRKNRGLWYRFKPDGTFEAGHWRDYTTAGVWALKYGAEYPLLLVEALRNELSGEYQIQGISGDEVYMSWVGTAMFNQKGHAVKVENLLSAPTRQQYGVEE